MQTANRIRQAIRKMGENRTPLTRVYRCLYSEDLYLAAYAKIYCNRGALTPGTDPNDTADGMSIADIHDIIDELRHERFRFSPARRDYEPKKNGGQRPLAKPNWTDKLVQEALRQLLDAYYEPRFRASSHGFRPKRGCHTALERVSQQFQGTTWFIEGDIRGCFDNISHDILMDILSRDIQDGRLLNLIRMGLEAGVMEEWEYHKTYSGTPQGGILSPVLSNIYLHELDVFVEDVLIPKYTRGKRRRVNPDYKRYEYRIRRAREAGDHDLANQLDQERRHYPSQNTHDPDYRRLSYVRYADDFLLGFIGPKHEAEAIKAEIGQFLREKLALELSDTKTLITHARTGHARFLGYAISTYHSDDKMSQRGETPTKTRSINGGVRLGIPYGLTTERARRYQVNGKTRSETRLLDNTDAHIIDKYQSRFRGLAEYYKYAVDRHQLGALKNVMQQALVKTLAHKYRTTVTRIYRKYRSTQNVDGYDYCTLAVEVPTSKGTRTVYWGAIPLRAVKAVGSEPLIDNKYKDEWTTGQSDLIQRLQANQCECCGVEIACEVHHVRKLANLKKRWKGRKEKPEWVKRMLALRRKTLVVCHDCHVRIHSGHPTPKRRE